MTTNLEKQCALVLAKRVGYDAFVNATRREFLGLAASLLRRWAAPMPTEDVVQELYLGAWLTFFPKDPSKRFDPKRGTPLHKFIVFNAMSHAKRAIHKARGAKLSGTADKNPSHIETPLSALGRGEEDGDVLLNLVLFAEPIAESALIGRELREEAVERALRACTSARERVAVRALALAEGGDVDGAGRVLYDDIDTRIALRLGSEEHATRYVTSAALAVASRLDAALAS